MPIDIKLPALGDNIESGDVLEVKVSEGDVIKKDQGIVELETDKATVEVPSTHSGKVLKIHIKDGETVKIGAPLITLEEEAGASASPPKPASAAPQAKQKAAEPPPKKQAAPQVEESAEDEEPSEGDEPQAEAQPKPQTQKPAASPAASRPAAPAAKASAAPATEEDEDDSEGNGAIPAGPSVRRFAREVGVDLSRVTGSGPGGRITREDVLSVVRTVNEVVRGKGEGAVRGKGESAGRGKSESAAEHGAKHTASVDYNEADSWGPVRNEKLPKIRKTIAAKMSESWSTATRVTNFDDADITELERIRKASKDDYAVDGIKLTTLPFVIKAAAMALRKHPVINATIDLANERVTYKGYVSIGIAVDTDRGLVVPALRNADKLSIAEIARKVAGIAEDVRSGSYGVDDLRGSSFTISNLGAIGGTYSTPMINVPEVAILLLGRARKLPVVVDDQVAVRMMMPLSLSYDHRLVDGAAAARFLNDVISLLEAPSRLLLAP